MVTGSEGKFGSDDSPNYSRHCIAAMLGVCSS